MHGADSLLHITQIYAIGNKDIIPMRLKLNTEVNQKELIPFLNSEEKMSDVSYIQVINNHLIPLFFEWKNWEGLKRILRKLGTHALMLEAITDEFKHRNGTMPYKTEGFWDWPAFHEFGRWIICDVVCAEKNSSTIRAYSDLCSAIVIMHPSLLAVLKKHDLAYLVETEQLLDALRGEDTHHHWKFQSDQKRIEGYKLVVSELLVRKVDKSDPLVVEKFETYSMIYYAFKEGNLELLRVLKNDFGISIKHYLDKYKKQISLGNLGFAYLDGQRVKDMAFFLFCSGIEIEDEILKKDIFKTLKERFIVFSLINHEMNEMPYGEVCDDVMELIVKAMIGTL